MGRPRRADTASMSQTSSRPAPVTSPGVLILSLTREPIYLTPSARTFLAELDGSPAASWDGSALPPAIHHVCDELQHNRRDDLTATDWGKMHALHLAQTACSTILVRGYGILDQHSGQTGRFLILLEAISTGSPAPIAREDADHQFTERQQGVLNGLLMGHSNKEIAANLQISVHTVKEYIRQIMLKLHATSRTGIVARVAGFTLPSAQSTGQRKSQGPQSAVQVA